MKINYTLTFTLDTQDEGDSIFLASVVTMLAALGVNSDLTAVIDDDEPDPDRDLLVGYSGGHEPEPRERAYDPKKAQAHYNDAWLAVQTTTCPRCGAKPSFNCTSKSGREINVVSTHRGRIAKVK